jgi:hypothetical protein
MTVEDIEMNTKIILPFLLNQLENHCRSGLLPLFAIKMCNVYRNVRCDENVMLLSCDVEAI